MVPNNHNQTLADAFEAFTQMSIQLETSYRELELRVAELNSELTATHTERVQQLVEKERLADRLQTLLSTLPAAVLVLDGTERIRDNNQIALDLLGAPLVGEYWSVVAGRAFESGSSGDNIGRLHNGRRLTIASRTLDNEPGRILVLQDITETCALQDVVNRNKRLGAMGEMAASLAHQIRTPLSAAVLYCAHLAKDHLPNGDRARFAGRLSERLRHLERLVNDMLAFARGGRAGDDLFSLQQLLDEVHANLEVQLQAANACWSQKNRAIHVGLRGNKDALLGTLNNLVVNSLQVNQAERPLVEIQVDLTCEGALEIRVRDNGPGIPSDQHERIFEPFYTNRPGGTGLGLAVVQSTIRAHHGEIAVINPSCGGVEFVIRLPEARVIIDFLCETDMAQIGAAAAGIKLRSNA